MMMPRCLRTCLKSWSRPFSPRAPHADQNHGRRSVIREAYLPFLSESHTNVGWTLGAGAEMGFAPNWSAKIEYLYVDLSNSNFVITGASNGYRFGLVRAGVNYHF